MNLGSISKAIAGAVAGGAGAVATVAAASYVTIPDGVQAPWWGYVLVGVANAAIGFAVVYIAPRNSQ